MSEAVTYFLNAGISSGEVLNYSLKCIQNIEEILCKNPNEVMNQIKLPKTPLDFMTILIWDRIEDILESFYFNELSMAITFNQKDRFKSKRSVYLFDLRKPQVLFQKTDSLESKPNEKEEEYNLAKKIWKRYIQGIINDLKDHTEDYSIILKRPGNCPIIDSLTEQYLMIELAQYFRRKTNTKKRNYQVNIRKGNVWMLILTHSYTIIPL